MDRWTIAFESRPAAGAPGRGPPGRGPRKVSRMGLEHVRFQPDRASCWSHPGLCLWGPAAGARLSEAPWEVPYGPRQKARDTRVSRRPLRKTSHRTHLPPSSHIYPCPALSAPTLRELGAPCTSPPSYLCTPPSAATPHAPVGCLLWPFVVSSLLWMISVPFPHGLYAFFFLIFI